MGEGVGVVRACTDRGPRPRHSGRSLGALAEQVAEQCGIGAVAGKGQPHSVCCLPDPHRALQQPRPDSGELAYGRCLDAGDGVAQFAYQPIDDGAQYTEVRTNLILAEVAREVSHGLGGWPSPSFRDLGSEDNGQSSRHDYTRDKSRQHEILPRASVRSR